MKQKMRSLVIFFAVLILLQQGIAYSNSNISLLKKHVSIIEMNNIDPSVMFYTESEVLLSAEKKVRSITDP